MIVNKCRNNRKRRDKNLPVVQSAISKRKHAIEKNIVNRKTIASEAPDGEPEVQEGVQPALRKGLSAYGIVNYLPVRDPSEDDETIQKHLKMLAVESLKKSSNPRLIDVGMKSTFADRRAMIVTNKAPMSLIKETYPRLFNPYQVSKIFTNS